MRSRSANQICPPTIPWGRNLPPARRTSNSYSLLEYGLVGPGMIVCTEVILIPGTSLWRLGNLRRLKKRVWSNPFIESTGRFWRSHYPYKACITLRPRNQLTSGGSGGWGQCGHRVGCRIHYAEPKVWRVPWCIYPRNLALRMSDYVLRF